MILLYLARHEVKSWASITGQHQQYEALANDWSAVLREIISHISVCSIVRLRVGRKPDAHLFYLVRRLLTNRGIFTGSMVFVTYLNVNREALHVSCDWGLAWASYCCLVWKVVTWSHNLWGKGLTGRASMNLSWGLPQDSKVTFYIARKSWMLLMASSGFLGLRRIFEVLWAYLFSDLKLIIQKIEYYAPFNPRLGII